MNILTKICVVLLTLVAIAASVTFVIYARVKPSWRHYYRQERQLRKVWGNKCIELAAAVDTLEKRYVELRHRMDNEIQTRDEKIVAKDNEIARLENKVQEENLDNKKLQNELNALRHINEQQAKRIASYKQSSEEQLKEEFGLRNEVTDLTRQLDEEKALTRRLEKSLDIVRRQKENQKKVIDELSEKLVKLEQELRKYGGEVQEEAPVVSDQITGAIVAIGQGIASINIGSANGVKQNMEFIIYRGKEYVGKLTVKRVRVAESAGVVTYQKQSPAEGDRVVNRLNLGSGI